METQKSSEKIYVAVTALTRWVTLIVQLYLTITFSLENGLTFFEGLIKYFSYFTILTNLLVAICMTSLWLSPQSNSGKFFSNPVVKAAVAVYILMVGIIYNLLLRQIWNPRGMAMSADEFLHVIIPVLFLLYWFIFVPKGHLKWIHPLYWLLYPVIYIIYSLIRGEFSGLYPYPFVDVNLLGYKQVFINTALILAGFVITGLVFVSIDRLWSVKKIKQDFVLRK